MGIPRDGEELLESCLRKSDDRLFQELEALRGGEARVVALALARLAVLDSRKAARSLAEASLFVYCTRRLGYSEAEAYLRIRVARAASDYPRILTMIGRGEIHVSAVARIAPHLTRENYRSLLTRASRRTIAELERLTAELAPRPEPRPLIRALSCASNAPPSAPDTPQTSLFDAQSKTDESSRADEPSPADAPQRANDPPQTDDPQRTADDPPPFPRDAGACSPRPAAGRVLFRFAASATFRAKYERARELLRHTHPSGEPEAVFDEALEALLDRKDPWRRLARKAQPVSQRQNRMRRPGP